MKKFNSVSWEVSFLVAVRIFAITIVLLSPFAVGYVLNIQSDNSSVAEFADASQTEFNLGHDNHSNPNSESGFNCDHLGACSSVALVSNRPNMLIVATSVVLPEFVNTIVGRSIEPPYFPPKI